ncbi:MAG: phosphoribosylformylglycinamidine synthase subunit PurS [Myxococcota bacterium]
MYRCALYVKPKTGVRDPQGEAVAESLRGVGYAGFQVHHVGRMLSIDVEAQDEPAARALIDEMCKRLLVNPNLETYELSVEKL